MPAQFPKSNNKIGTEFRSRGVNDDREMVSRLGYVPENQYVSGIPDYKDRSG
jgi:hypothetical protein